MDNDLESTIFDIPENIGFYSITQNRGLKLARLEDALYKLPTVLAKNRKPPLPAIEIFEDSNEDVSDDLHGEGKKIIIPSNVIDIYTILAVLLG